jgi:methylmalonyl-CoA mutase cobalamin-binding domain/chain
VVVLVGNVRTSDRGARALAGTLRQAGFEIVYLGRQRSARRIAAAADEAGADAVEVCLAGGGGLVVLRDLLRELRRLGRREVGIVVHRVQ